MQDILTSIKFDDHGLCYVSNCYNEEYLQVGIGGQLGLYWYGCPPEGGKMYIAGSLGSVRCPVAKEFCRYETLSGKMEGETNPILEWVLFGVLGCAVLIALILLCVFWKKVDQKVHFWCGINRDQEDWDKILESRQGKRSTSGYVLAVIGAIWALAGVVLLGFSIHSFLTLLGIVEPFWIGQTRLAPTMFCIAAFTVVVSIVAIVGAWKNRPNILLIVYFYVCVITLVICLVIPIVPFILTDPLEYMLEDLWLEWKDIFADHWQSLSSAAAMEKFANETLLEFAPLIAFVGIVSIASVIAGIVCAILQLTIHVLVRNFEVVMNSMFSVISIVLCGYSIKSFWLLDPYIYATAIIPASVFLMVGLIGIAAACQKHETCFKVWQVAAAIGFVVAFVTASILVVVAMPPALQDTVSSTTPSTCYELEGSPVVCNKTAPMCCSCIIRNVDILYTAGTTDTPTTSEVNYVTRCEDSCYDVPGYSCTEVESDATTTAPIETFPLMLIEPYIRALSDDRIAEITSSIADPESSSL